MRVYLTADGRHVREGSPDSQILVYGEDDEIPADVQAELDGKPVKAEPTPDPADQEPAEKQAPAKSAKQRTPQANK